METKTFTFKTNINCGGCIAKVTPFLDEVKGIKYLNTFYYLYP